MDGHGRGLRYRFAGCELQPDERRLLVQDEPVALNARAFDLLLALVERPGQLVTKAELLDRVWPNRVVEDNNVHVHIGALRKLLGSEAIATVVGRGYRFTHDVEWRSAAPKTPAHARHRNLPAQVTSFVGRDRELSDIGALLHNHRLVTLVGVGGIGKTRLSIEVGRAALGDSPDGVWFVDLAPLADGALVAQAVAAVFGVKQQPAQPVIEALVEYLGSRRCLVILDNCEHLLDACAETARRLLRSTPHMKLIATSREHLNIAGESTYVVPPLQFCIQADTAVFAAASRLDAVDLFADRARAAHSAFEVTRDNAAAVMDICRQVDGIPLAIELAAARVRALSLDEIRARLDDRFSLLTGGDRTALPRQQTLRGCIDWSCRLLDTAESMLLARLAVFAGGWSLKAAEAVCGEGDVDPRAVLDLLTHLVEKSLVAVDAERRRYRLLDTVRQYARERLAESDPQDATRLRHALYFLALGEEATPHLRGGPEQKRWLALLDADEDNVRAAMTWALERSDHAELALRLCGTFYRFWMYRGQLQQAYAWCDTALTRAPGGREDVALAGALLATGTIGFNLGRDDAGDLLERAIAVGRAVGDRYIEAAALHNLSNFWSEHGTPEKVRTLLEQACAINHELGNASWELINITSLANFEFEQGEYDAAHRNSERALASSRETGNRWMEAQAISQLASLARARHDYALARRLHEQSGSTFREFGMPAWEINDTLGLADVALACGDLGAARERFGDALKTFVETGMTPGLADCLDLVGIFAVVTRDHVMAATMWGAAERVRSRFKARASPYIVDRRRPHGAQCRQALDSVEYEDARSRGCALDTQAAITEAARWLSQFAAHGTRRH